MTFTEELGMHLSRMATNEMFIVFVLTLLTMAMFPFKKDWGLFKTSKYRILGFGTILLASMYIYKHGAPELYHLFYHEHDGHRKIDLIYEMIQLFMGFEIVEFAVKRSGFDRRLAKTIQAPSEILILVFCLSSLMDNILMTLIGGAIAVSLFRGAAKVPFKLFVLIVAAANLGGAWSFIGDTTTIMINLAMGSKEYGATPVGLLNAFVGSIAALKYILWYSKRNMPKIEPIEEATPVKWNLLAILVFGITGIIIGNLWFHQPGIGLLLGCGIGFLVGGAWNDISISAKGGFWHSDVGHIIHNGALGAYVISVLIAMADMLPLDLLIPALNMFAKDSQVCIIGLASGVFDNIPLTAICLVIGGFSWPLLAYAAGYGGSFFFFSSSGGVALAASYERVAETSKWLPHTFHILISYFIGFGCMLAFNYYFVPADTSIKVIIASTVLLLYIITAWKWDASYIPGKGRLRGKIAYVKANWY